MFNTGDMKESLDFYVGILGMRLVHAFKTVLRDPDKILNRGNLWHDKCRLYFLDMGSDALLAIFEVPEEGRVTAPNAVRAMQHCAFTVTASRYHELRQRLVDHGIEIIEYEVAGAISAFYFRDPNGIRIEFSAAINWPDDVDVVPSAPGSHESMREALLTLCDDPAWVDRMVASANRSPDNPDCSVITASSCSRMHSPRPRPEYQRQGQKKGYALSAEILGLELDRRAVRRAIGGVRPRALITRQRARVGDALLGDDPFERGEPVAVIGLAGIGIARVLGALDFLAQRLRPFLPSENAALIQGQHDREGLRLPRLVEDGSVGIAKNAGQRLGGEAFGLGIDRVHAGSR